MRGAALAFLGVALLGTPALAGEVTLRELTPCRSVERKAPVGATQRFAPTEGPVYVYLHFHNSGPPAAVVVAFAHEGKPVRRAKIEVGTSERWRTWARQHIDRTSVGRWSVEARGPKGEVLGRTSFVVAEDGSSRARVEAPERVEEPPRQPEPRPAPPERSRPAEPLEPPEPPEPTEPPEPPEPSEVAAGHPEERSAKARGVGVFPARCRALVTVLVGGGDIMGAHIVDLRLGPGVFARTEPGLAVREGRTTWVARAERRVVVEDTRFGRVQRRWTVLRGARAPDGAVATWLGWRATLTGNAEATRYKYLFEHNDLVLESVWGPYISVQAVLRGYAGGDETFDRSRYAIIRAPGAVVDPRPLVGEGLADAARMRLAEVWPREASDLPDLERHDFRRAAFAVRHKSARLVTLLGHPDGVSGVRDLDIPLGNSPPASLADHLPDAEGWYVAPDHCGAVGNSPTGPQIRIGGAGTARPLKLGFAATVTVVGAAWIPPGDPFDLDRVAELLGVAHPD